LEEALYLQRDQLGPVKDYLALSLELLKEKLVEAKPDEFMKLQGEAFALTKLLRTLTVPKATIAKGMTDNG
jgi:hypothetical protein